MFKTKLLNVFHRLFATPTKTKHTRTVSIMSVKTPPTAAVKTISGTWNDIEPRKVDDFESIQHLLTAPGERLVKPPTVTDAWSRWDMR